MCWNLRFRTAIVGWVCFVCGNLHGDLNAQELTVSRHQHGKWTPIRKVVFVGQAEQEESEGLDPGGSTDAEIEEESDEPIVDSASVETNDAIGKKYIRFHMWDGAVVGGDVSMHQLQVQTEFGSLAIPIEKIVSFYPGLDSFPERKQMIDTLVTQLGDRDYDVRERAHRQLQGMGLQLRKQLYDFDDGGSAERKKHLTDLRKELEEVLEDLEEEAEDPDNLDRALIDGDMINTPDFSVVGKIQQPTFQIASRYGQLTIRLQDIRFADRSFNQPRAEIRKSVAVSGSTFFQKTPKSARIRVNRGDKITIRASGNVNWTNWNNNSSPEGLQNQGSWNGITCGALCARVGKSGEVIKIGSKESFVAKKSGVLYLAIAMKDNYANNTSYRWDGEFKARIVVTPKAN
jgi:signal peptidase I